MPIRTARPLLRRWTSRSSRDKPDPWLVRYYVRRAANWTPGAQCLVQAIAAQMVLTRAGYQPIIRVGVNRENGAIGAHAWLLLDNEILLGATPDLASYTVLTDLDP